MQITFELISVVVITKIKNMLKFKYHPPIMNLGKGHMWVKMLSTESM